jgi:hypothetical protein
VPPGARPGWEAMSNRLSDLLATLPNRIPVGVDGRDVFRVRDDGGLQEVRLDPELDADVRGALAFGQASVTGGTVSPTGRESCITAGPHGAILEIRPWTALRSGPDFYLRIERSTGANGRLPVLVDRGVGYPPQPDRALPSQRRSGITVLELGGMPGTEPVFAGARIAIPRSGRACFGSLAVGRVVPSTVG